MWLRTVLGQVGDGQTRTCGVKAEKDGWGQRSARMQGLAAAMVAACESLNSGRGVGVRAVALEHGGRAWL